MQATLFSSNGSQSEIELSSFSQAQKLVHGLVQVLHLNNKDILLVNEEGLVLDLPANPFFPNLSGNVLLVNANLFNSLPY